MSSAGSNKRLLTCGADLSSSMFSRTETDRSLTASSASRDATPTAAEELMPLLSTSLDDRSSARMPRANLAGRMSA